MSSPGITLTRDAFSVRHYLAGSGHLALHAWIPFLLGKQEIRAPAERSKGGLKDHEKDSETLISIRVFALFLLRLIPSSLSVLWNQFPP